MSHRSSNIERIQWGISLLNIQPSDIILEIGFGPGVAINMMSKKLEDGVVYGIDHSRLMLKQASKLNKAFIDSGRVKLMENSVSDLPTFENKIDKIIDINSFQFWDSPVESLSKLKSNLKPGGLIAIVHQPRNPGATDTDAIESANQFSRLMKQAGFVNIRIEKKVMKPVSTICVIGANT